MSNHSPYIFTPATGKMRRDGIIDSSRSTFRLLKAETAY